MKKKKKRLPVLPPDPLKHYRGATMGPGEYEIKRDLLQNKPKTISKGVGFNSRAIRFDFMEPKKEPKDVKTEVDKEEDIMNSLIFSRSPNELKKKEFPSKIENGNFAKEDRFKDVSINPYKQKQPGPGAYDINGFAKSDFQRESAFFRSNSKRLGMPGKTNKNCKFFLIFLSYDCWSKSRPNFRRLLNNREP